MTSRPTTSDPATLDLYKLAVEMADRVSARRAGANSFFLTLQTAVVAALGFLAAAEPAPNKWHLVALCCVGVIGNVVWFLLLRSYRDLNTAKFTVIQRLEQQLPVALFEDEWQLLKTDPVKHWRARYAELGSVERLAPTLFALMNCVTGTYLICS